MGYNEWICGDSASDPPYEDPGYRTCAICHLVTYDWVTRNDPTYAEVDPKFAAYQECAICKECAACLERGVGHWPERDKKKYVLLPDQLGRCPIITDEVRLNPDARPQYRCRIAADWHRDIRKRLERIDGELGSYRELLARRRRLRRIIGL